MVALCGRVAAVSRKPLLPVHRPRSGIFSLGRKVTPRDLPVGVPRSSSLSFTRASKPPVPLVFHVTHHVACHF